jgi:hypothetical protein
MTSGATGQLYGNHATWTLPSNWKTHLDTTAVRELGYLQRLLSPLAWYNLTPDQTHTMLTSGYGAYATKGGVLSSNYATAARTEDGTLGIIYTPTVRTMTVNLAQFDGPVTARWYDPTDGTYTVVSGPPAMNVGTHQFEPSGKNSAGKEDWVLLLQA